MLHWSSRLVCDGMTEFTDPRLVDLYETLNAYDPGTQPAFYSELASSLAARTIVDIGCGTGLITRDLARQGYEVTGLDPSALMLAAARTRPYGDQVHWICGPVTALPALGADLAIMSGHIPQFFRTDESWSAALTAIAAALRPAGWLAFETRNPEARAWETWSTRRTATHGVTFWTETTAIRGLTVDYTLHYLFDSGEEVVAPGTLRWRTLEELTDSLTTAGFTVRRLQGNWTGAPTTPELILTTQLDKAGPPGVASTERALDPEPV
jgi:SAM-dependent methyltransferase